MEPLRRGPLPLLQQKAALHPSPAGLSPCEVPLAQQTSKPDCWALVPTSISLRSAKNKTLLVFKAVFILKFALRKQPDRQNSFFAKQAPVLG